MITTLIWILNAMIPCIPIIVALFVYRYQWKQQQLQYCLIESVGAIDVLIWSITSTVEGQFKGEYLKTLWERYEKIFILNRKLILLTKGVVNNNDISDTHGFCNSISSSNLNFNDFVDKSAIDKLRIYKEKLTKLYNI